MRRRPAPDPALEARIRAALTAHNPDLEVDPDALDRIRDRILKRPEPRPRSWLRRHITRD